MIRYLSIAVMMAAAAGSAAAQRQSREAIPGATIPGTTVRPVPPAEALPTDPRLADEGQLPLRVQVLPAAAMVQEDKDLAGSVAAAIRERAALNELGFDRGDWQESQVVCPAFPHHLFLRYTLDRGTGDVSLFTVSVPRGKGGRVRVIPILRRGFSPIAKAPESKVTMAAFNQIQTEEHLAKADWSAVSMCYAALTSARWKEPQSEMTLSMVGSRTLVLGEHGTLSVALELDEPAAGRWVVIFDRAGDVTKTEYTPFGDLIWRRLPAPVVEARGKPVPAPQDAEKGRPVPTGPEPTGKPVPAPTESQPQ